MEIVLFLYQELIQLAHRNNTNPVLVDILISCLQDWIPQTPSTPISPFQQYDCLIVGQPRIGWDQILSVGGPSCGHNNNL
jgi:hypothetical protein